MTNRISEEALDVLRHSTVDEQANTVTLGKDALPRNLYEEVDDVLTRIGGKWNRKHKAHVFPYNPAPLFFAVIASEELPPKNPTAFFPTPDNIVQGMISASGLNGYWQDLRILEPSAGTGAIAKTLSELGKDSNWQIDCCEFLPVNRQALINSGFNVVAEDFLEYKPECRYDAILMNPPFSVEGNPTAYVDHIYHAWDLLTPAGILAAIVPTGWTYASNNKKVIGFREFVGDWLGFEEVGAGAFKESGTNVNTAIVYGEKNGGKCWRCLPYNGWNSYHAWNASLWIDNEADMYHAARSCPNRQAFDILCKEYERNLWKLNVPIVLRQADVEELWRYYKEDD